jgi:hypothetical protein
MSSRLEEFERLLIANARGASGVGAEAVIRWLGRTVIEYADRQDANAAALDAALVEFRERALQRVADTVDPVVTAAQQTADLLSAYLATIQGEGLGAGLVTVAEAEHLDAGSAQAALEALAAALATHGHAIEAIDGLATALAGKAAASHTHQISQVQNLTSQLAGKAGIGVAEFVVLTASETWVVPTAARRLRFTAIGGGGGGGGARTTAVEECAIGGGGGAGAEAIHWLTGTLPESLVVSIGAGGAAGASVSVNLLLTVSAGGGSGGNASGAVTGPIVVQGGAGGVAANGTINRDGERGWLGALVEPTRNHAWAGRGGSTRYGAGGVARESSSSSSRVGDDGTGFGTGGGGAISKSSGSADPQAGGAGRPGVVIIEWWR